MLLRLNPLLAAASALLLAVSACSSDDDGAATGGSSSDTGGSGTGGSTADTGGSSATGGSSSDTGGSGTGGSTADTGGSSDTGGSPGTGGTSSTGGSGGGPVGGGATGGGSSTSCDQGSLEGCNALEVTYALSGDFEITGAGADTAEVGPGTLILRFPIDGEGEIVDGPVRVLHYRMTQDFDTQGGDVQTDTLAETVDLECGVAVGTLTGTSLTFDCAFDGGEPSDWVPDDENDPVGPGCLADYHSTGNVVCELGANPTLCAIACAIGSLSCGNNPQDETWDMRFNDLTFDADYEAVEMAQAQVPNRAPGQTYIAFSSTASTRTYVAAPTCE